MQIPKINKSVVGWLTTLGIVAILTTSGTITYTVLRFASTHQSHPKTSVAKVPEFIGVAALGRLEPKGEVIKLSAPNSIEGNRVEQLLVKQGDKVKVGQIIAILDNRDRLLATLEKAKEDVKIAKARLAQVKAGAKAGDINAQKANITRIEAEQRGQIIATQAEIARWQAELANAQKEYKRYQFLYKNGAISDSNLDSKHLIIKTVTQQINAAKANLQRIKKAQQEQLNEAKSTLTSIKEVRTVDVQVAEAEVRSAEAVVKQAQANLNLAYVRATQNGQILKIHTYAGEIVSKEGIAELGQTNKMYVVAEVYETDISKVRVGQKSIITSDVFVGKLNGIVEEFGLQIGKKDIFDTDPTASIDARVVEVKIALDRVSSQKVAGLTNLQVKTLIQQ
ncbi:ABC exporter membrane fusion protein [Chlorogloeopsis sp. ULAP01]|uniref:ABC exporter membrane fusion protein n=1 Tax=Chlorogloeopsis sp. ULAP01 TaxID=3056483 RepID=UPI0025AAA105|nr:ABC exporter membrane fusion protein [Chlorogloeopsis sp. ULAP01]MDM9383808.1 ABC exporter membrane fusion protein [Chlorogloeopsis sp. ULAP01]